MDLGQRTTSLKFHKYRLAAQVFGTHTSFGAN
jgi:hypothetical protein